MRAYEVGGEKERGREGVKGNRDSRVQISPEQMKRNENINKN